CVVTKMRHGHWFEKNAAVGMRIHPHPPTSFGRQRRQLVFESSILVKQFFRLVAAHPIFEDAQMSWIVPDIVHRHLMRAPRSFDRLAVDFFWTSPSFEGAQDQQRPAGTLDHHLLAGTLLNR